LICNAATCGAGLAPRSGETLAWLGGANLERSRVYQQVTLPAGKAARLTYWYRIESEDRCFYDIGYVRLWVGASNIPLTLRRYILCAAANTNGWRQDSLDLSQYAGKQVRVDFYVSTDRYKVSNLFIDDVSLRSGANCTLVSSAMLPDAAWPPALNEPFVEVEPPAREPEAPGGELRWRR
jgi:hypothetical protein